MFDELTMKTIVFVLTARTKFEKIETSTVVSKNDDSIRRIFDEVFEFE